MNAKVNGLLVLDKPQGITSRKAVDLAMRWFPRGMRIGHTGTLDPLASGVLVLCLGNATRLVDYVQRMGKTYRSLFRLGARSDTDDADGEVSESVDAADPGITRIRSVLDGFIGTIEQTPPAYSAAKVTGRRAYDLARRGETVQLLPRTVRIDRIDIQGYAYPNLEVEVRCGKGTYIRSIARDLGDRLGCGGFVQSLRRTRVGTFSVEQAVSLDANEETARNHVLPARLAVSELPRLVLPPPELMRLRQGQEIAMEGEVSFTQGEVAVYDEAGTLIAVGIVNTVKGTLRPDKVFA